MIIEISDKGCKIHILLILGNVCLSVTGFEEPNVNHKRDLGVVELFFGKNCRRPKINLQGCIVGEGTTLSTMAQFTNRRTVGENLILRDIYIK